MFWHVFWFFSFCNTEPLYIWQILWYFEIMAPVGQISCPRKYNIFHSKYKWSFYFIIVFSTFISWKKYVFIWCSYTQNRGGGVKSTPPKKYLICKFLNFFFLGLKGHKKSGFYMGVWGCVCLKIFWVNWFVKKVVSILPPPGWIRVKVQNFLCSKSVSRGPDHAC